jgi:hypothetical protein
MFRSLKYVMDDALKINTRTAPGPDFAHGLQGFRRCPRNGPANRMENTGGNGMMRTQFHREECS